MIKISANIRKKVPIVGADFSSQQYGAAMEIEVPDADKPDVIHSLMPATSRFRCSRGC
jgi:hypothetical protein